MTLTEISHHIATWCTLTFLEIILGIDNMVVIALLTEKLPKAKQQSTQRLGLLLAWITRLLLLAFALKLTQLTKPLIHFLDWQFSARDIFLIIGGSFLVLNATQAIHEEISPSQTVVSYEKFKTVGRIIIQIGLIDILFSLDSILTAVGLTKHFIIIATSVTTAIAFMMIATKYLSQFIHDNQTVKMLALSFIILIGTVLIADGFHIEIPRGYIYISILYALFIETLNILKTKKTS